MLRSTRLKTEIVTGFALINEGLEILTYIDTNGQQMEDPIKHVFNYEELKINILDSIVIGGVGSEKLENIKNGNYKLDKDEATLEIISEVTKLKEFAESLEKEMTKNLKNKK